MKFEKREFAHLEINPIAEAEVYYTYGRIDQAFNVLYNSLREIQSTQGWAIIFDEYLSIAKHLYALYNEQYAKMGDNSSNRTIYIANITREAVKDFIAGFFPKQSSYHQLLTQMFVEVEMLGNVSSEDIDNAVQKVLSALLPKESKVNDEVNDEIQPKAQPIKERMINRLICLSNQCNLPGFESTPEKLHKDFMAMPDDLFMTMFELIVIQAHRDGHQ